MTPANIVVMAHLKGLDAIAVCDHNSMGNLPAVKAAADRYGILLLPGIELTTKEEVHMLCYFRDLESALPFSQEVYRYLPDIPNNPAFFGRQLLMDENDEVTGEERKLLISALDLSFEDCARLCHLHGGACVPAHIGRGANGVLSVLGFLPPQVEYDAVEIGRNESVPPMYAGRYLCLQSSDAHRLEDISERTFFLDAREKSLISLFCAIKKHV